MLGLDGDDVVALLLVELGHALDREVVRLGRAGGEDDLLVVAADQRRDLLARVLDRGLGLPAERVVAARRVAEVLGEVRQHRLDTRGSTGVVAWLSMKMGSLTAISSGSSLRSSVASAARRRRGISVTADARRSRRPGRRTRAARPARARQAGEQLRAPRPAGGPGDRTRRTRSGVKWVAQLWHESR